MRAVAHANVQMRETVHGDAKTHVIGGGTTFLRPRSPRRGLRSNPGVRHLPVSIQTGSEVSASNDQINFRSRIVKIQLGPANLWDSLPVTLALTAQVHDKQLKRTGVTRRLSSILGPGGRVRERDYQIHSNRVVNLILVDSFHRLLVLNNPQMKRPWHP